MTTDELAGNADDETGGTVAGVPGAHPHPGDLVVGAGGEASAPGGEPDTSGPVGTLGLRGGPETLVGEDEDTPLDEGEDSLVPKPVLWALKDHRHIQWHLLPAADRHEEFRESLGPDQHAVYAIDDGADHAMLGHPVGATRDGCDYILVGRITLEQLEDLRQQKVATPDAFTAAEELALCGVADVPEALSATVFDVARYRSADEIPLEFLPGTPFRLFKEDLPVD